jgi:hypothetical protein
MPIVGMTTVEQTVIFTADYTLMPQLLATIGKETTTPTKVYVQTAGTYQANQNGQH